MSNVDLNARIPNNVGLADDRRLQRALEKWQPGYIEWWKSMGPEGFQEDDVYLRTAVSVDADVLAGIRADADILFRGEYDDVPLDEIQASFKEFYDGVSSVGDRADFDTDVERETKIMST